MWGMRWIGGTAAVVVLVSACITARMTKERFTHTNRNMCRYSGDQGDIRNRPFVILLVMKMAKFSAVAFVGGMTFYLGLYYTCRGTWNSPRSLPVLRDVGHDFGILGCSLW